MSPTPIRTIDDLLTEVALEHLRSCLWAPLGHSLFEWDRALSESRPDFLYQLKACGVTVLKERQALSNALSRARREGRLLPPQVPPKRETPQQPAPQHQAQGEDDSACWVIVCLKVSRLHTGWIRTKSTLAPVRSRLARATRVLLDPHASQAELDAELSTWPARAGFEQELTPEATRLVELGSRFAPAAAMHRVLQWVHSGWDSAESVAAAGLLVPTTDRLQAHREAGLLHNRPACRQPLDLQVMKTVVLCAMGNRFHKREAYDKFDMQNVDLSASRICAARCNA